MRFRAAVLALAATLVSGRAVANIAAASEDAASVTGPRFVAGTKVRVTDEELAITCVEREGAPSCRFEASYRITNPETTREDVFAAFYGVHTADVEVALDGVAVSPRSFPPEVLDALDDAALREEDAPDHARIGSDRKPERFPFQIVVEPGATRVLRVTGAMTPGRRFVPRGYVLPPYEARHLAFASKGTDRHYDLVYLVGPIRSWAGAPKIRVRIRFPSTWQADEPFRPSTESELSRWSLSREGGETVATRTLGADAPAILPFAFRIEAPAVRIGGLLLGIGGTMGDRGGLRLRLAGELAGPDWLLYSTAFETNARDRMFLVPAIHAATSPVFFIPSIGAGLGVPIQIRPDPRVGVRVQGDLHLYPLGFFAAVDVYPKTTALPPLTEFALFFQVGL